MNNDNGLLPPLGAGAGAGAGAGGAGSAANAIAFLSSLTFTIDTEKEPVSYLFEAEDQTRQLITVIATKPNGSEYWRQVFYNSSGTASRIKDAWFPISAIIPGEAGFYKKDPPLAARFKENDILYQPSGLVRENDMRVRIKTFSFLLAILGLVSDDVATDIIKKLSISALTPLQKEILGGIIANDKIGSLRESIPKEAVLLQHETTGAYETINNWIGGDNYTGQLPLMRGLYGGRRKHRTRHRRSHKRSTRRRIHRRR